MTITLTGLSVHSVIEGFGLAATLPVGGLGMLLFVSILVHKVPAVAALTSLMVLAKHSRRKIVLCLMVLFSYDSSRGIGAGSAGGLWQ